MVCCGLPWFDFDLATHAFDRHVSLAFVNCAQLHSVLSKQRSCLVPFRQDRTPNAVLCNSRILWVFGSLDVGFNQKYQLSTHSRYKPIASREKYNRKIKKAG